eukprot:GEZU01032440.1.p1 GENE.GEZU01032440.1~~GEZU01032440.1.p1  ORF type:complete len:484 (+),score=170.08 GEZU01032440.1:79-1452(+)
MWARSLTKAVLKTGSTFKKSATVQKAATGLLNSTPNASKFQVRFLNIHEHQSHELLAKYGVKTPKGIVAFTPEEAEAAAKQLAQRSRDFVVKAQILAGGRGKGAFDNGFKGGVHVAMSPEQARDLASKMLNHKLITKQTGAEGKLVSRVFIQERVYARRELYFAILMDRQFDGPVMIGSQRGGMNIEDVAKETPEEIYKEKIDIDKGMQPEQAEAMAKKMGFTGASLEAAKQQMIKLWDVFIKSDATLLEINPLIETPENEVLCADCKINFDDNADFRQKEIFAMRDPTQEDPREAAAAQFGLSYIGLDGNIGCIVNGAGLAMATMDIIKLHGGNPANFLDVGGGATKEQVTEALKILNSDPRVQAILVNIFGGIMRCDVIALGIIAAAQTVNLNVPLVVRLKGTRVEEGKKLIADSGLRIVAADDLDDAAQKAVRMADIVNMAKEIDVKVHFELPL